MIKRKTNTLILDFIRTWWVGVIIATIVSFASLYQIKYSIDNEETQKKLKINELKYQAFNLLGFKPLDSKTMGLSMPKGRIEVTDSVRERLEKSRRIIEKINILSDGEDTELSMFKFQYFYQLGEFDNLKNFIFEQHGPGERIYALAQIAMMYANTKGLENEAILYYEQALKISPNNLWLLNSYGGILHTLEKNEDAITVLKRALVLSPFHDSVTQILVHVYTESENMDKAITLLVEYHQEGKGTHNTHFTLGSIYNHNENHKLAIEEYEKGLILFPQSADIHYGLSHVYSKIEDKQKSDKHKKLSEGYRQDLSDRNETTYFNENGIDRIKNYFSELFTD